jgi:hypothetical protein
MSPKSGSYSINQSSVAHAPAGSFVRRGRRSVCWRSGAQDSPTRGLLWPSQTPSGQVKVRQ